MSENDLQGQSGSKGVTWGPSTKGAFLSAAAAKDTIRAGEPLTIAVRLRNEGSRPLPLLSSDATLTYRLLAIRPDGTLAQKSERLQRAESSSAQPGAVTRSVTMLQPNTETAESLSVADFRQLPAGEYQIVVIRKTTSWEDGFLFSNAVRIRVVAP